MFNLGRYVTMLGGITGVLATLALLTLPLMQYCSLSFPDASAEVTVSQCVESNLIASQGGRLEFVTIAYLIAMTSISAAVAVVSWRAAHPNFATPILLLSLGAVLALGMLIAGFSIGFFYAPSVTLTLFGACTMLLANMYSTRRDRQITHNR